jgi:hypothetical protein
VRTVLYTRRTVVLVQYGCTGTTSTSTTTQPMVRTKDRPLQPVSRIGTVLVLVLVLALVVLPVVLVYLVLLLVLVLEYYWLVLLY